MSQKEENNLSECTINYDEDIITIRQTRPKELAPSSVYQWLSAESALIFFSFHTNIEKTVGQCVVHAQVRVSVKKQSNKASK